MKFIMFQKEFAPLIQSGIKTSTIRPQSKRPYKVGEVLSARYWSEKPYRSKQVEFARIRVTETKDTRLFFWKGLGLSLSEIASTEGFKDTRTMIEWFHSKYGDADKPVTQYRFQLEAS